MKIRLLLGMALMAAAGMMPARAQYFTIGPEVGYERANLHADGDDPSDLSTKSGNGFRIGAVAAYNFRCGVSINAGLSYSHRGGAAINGVSGLEAFPHVKNVEIRKMDFMTLPVTVGYELGFAKGWGIGVEAGGYISTGIGDGSTLFVCTDGERNGGSLFAGSSFTHYDAESNDRVSVSIGKSGRTDAGIALGGHVRFNRVRLRVLYQLGLNKTIYDIAKPYTCALSLCYDFRL